MAVERTQEVIQKELAEARRLFTQESSTAAQYPGMQFANNVRALHERIDSLIQELQEAQIAFPS